MMKTNLKTRGQRGAAMIEFAIVLPVLLILLLGTIDFSLLLYNKAMITNASREGARLGIVFNPVGGLTHPQCGEIRTRAQQYAQDHLITFANPNPGSIIKSCIYAETEDPTVPCPADCSGFAGTEAKGDFLKVEVDYTYDFLFFDFLPWLLLGTNAVDIKGVSIMRFE